MRSLPSSGSLQLLVYSPPPQIDIKVFVDNSPHSLSSALAASLVNMVNWNSPEQIAHDACKPSPSSLYCPSLTSPSCLRQAHPLSSWPIHVRWIIILLMLTCWLFLSFSKLGMGGVARIRLAVHLWSKDIPLAHGLFRLYIRFKTHCKFRDLQTFYFLNRYCLLLALIGMCVYSVYTWCLNIHPDMLFHQ